MAWNKMIPFNSKGHPIRYPMTWHGTGPVPARTLKLDNYPTEWREQHSFSACVEYAGYERGRSALNVKWKVISSKDHPELRRKFVWTGMGALDSLLSGHSPVSLAGPPMRFRVRLRFGKRGQNFLATLVEEG